MKIAHNLVSIACTFAALIVCLEFEPAKAESPTTLKKLVQGTASWYGPHFHGRRTASGAIYNMYQLTCAHRTLPFGTKLLVCNKTTAKTCLVTVNDRGPYFGRRVLDLSKAAAHELGITGLAEVVCYQNSEHIVASNGL